MEVGACKKIIFFTSLLMLIISGYKVSIPIRHDSSKKFIAHGYEEKVINVNGFTYVLVKKKEQAITNEILSIISLASPGSTVFIRHENGIYNISTSIRNNTHSFSFQENSVEKAKCKIKSVLSKGHLVCEQ